MEDRTVLAFTAIVTIGIVECVALACGVNGTLLALSIASMAGLGGYTVGVVRRHLKRE